MSQNMESQTGCRIKFKIADGAYVVFRVVKVLQKHRISRPAGKMTMRYFVNEHLVLLYEFALFYLLHLKSL